MQPTSNDVRRDATPVESRRSLGRRLTLWLGGLTVALAAAVALAASVGPLRIPFSTVGRAIVPIAAVAAPVGETERRVVRQIRLPRVVLGALIGMALAIAGATLQGLFGNPMADPGIIGVSAGGAAGSVIAIALGLTRRFPAALPCCAFAGALLAVVVVYRIALVRGRLSVPALLLAGITVTSFLTAVIALVIALAPTDAAMREMVFWLAGGLDTASWRDVRLTAPLLAAGALAILWLARDLNLLMQGDDEAQALGVRIDVVRPVLIAAAALITGAAVAVSGTIGFVGLIVPHVFRLLVGGDHRILIPVSAIGGALFLVVADTAARSLAPPAEIRVGIVTALVGAPFFMGLLLKHKRRFAAG